MRRLARRVAACTVLSIMLFASAVLADTVRVATWNAELQRDGPGLLLRDILKGNDPQIDGALDVIATTRPDILTLQGFDHDFDGLALSAFVEALSARDLTFPHIFAPPGNRGLETGLDMDGDGRLGTARDAQGYGRFTGQGAMAVLSRFPIEHDVVQDFTALLWTQLPGATLPLYPDGRPFPSPEAQAAQRLSSASHWVVPIRLPDGELLHLLTFHASPPVFDGAEDLNGLRNRDEIRLWQVYLAGDLGPAPSGRFVIAGSANLDPDKSEGRRHAIASLLADPRIQDPRPTGPDDDDLATVDWPPPGPGKLRVDYVLPSVDWRVRNAGLHQPATPGISRHRLVWVDLERAD